MVHVHVPLCMPRVFELMGSCDLGSMGSTWFGSHADVTPEPQLRKPDTFAAYKVRNAAGLSQYPSNSELRKYPARYREAPKTALPQR